MRAIRLASPLLLLVAIADVTPAEAAGWRKGWVSPANCLPRYGCTIDCASLCRPQKPFVAGNWSPVCAVELRDGIGWVTGTLTTYYSDPPVNICAVPFHCTERQCPEEVLKRYYCLCH
jgi:hypothetical protein